MKLLIQDLGLQRKAEVVTWENDLKLSGYTIHLLHELHHRGFSSLVFVMGADHLKDLPQWKDFPNHFKLASFWVAKRDKSQENEALRSYASQIHELPMTEVLTSSSRIREGSHVEYLTPSLKKFISDRKVYEN